MKHHNVTLYPSDSGLIPFYVCAQGLYRHLSPIVYSFPNISIAAAGTGTIAQYSDPFSRDAV